MRLILLAVSCSAVLPFASCTTGDEESASKPVPPPSSSSQIPWNKPIPGQGGYWKFLYAADAVDRVAGAQHDVARPDERVERQPERLAHLEVGAAQRRPLRRVEAGVRRLWRRVGGGRQHQDGRAERRR